MEYRIEKDLIGEKKVPENANYGINTLRAFENFNSDFPKVQKEIIQALVLVKKAAAEVNKEVGFLPSDKADYIIKACDDILSDYREEDFPLPALQGGAGTSINMNVNEVVANRALVICGHKRGDYSYIDPNDDVNKFQSTNDVYPTAVKLALIKEILELSYELADLQDSLQRKEKEFAHILKTGRTQLQDAVPITLGQEFSAYAQAFARDRWRIFKAEERLRQVNLGGTAVGTGATAPRIFIFSFIEKLRSLSGLGLARAENMVDITQNCDMFVEVSGILKAVAVNLIKISGDIRLLSSGPYAGIGEIILPQAQAGSSIMPGKINPVIPEFAGLSGMQVIACDAAVTHAAASGQLELNSFFPLIAYNSMQAVKILRSAIVSFSETCVKGICADKARCTEYLDRSLSKITLLIPYIGYHKATEIVDKVMKSGRSVTEVLVSEKLFTGEELEAVFEPYGATSPGIPGAEKFKERIKIRVYRSGN